MFNGLTDKFFFTKRTDGTVRRSSFLDVMTSNEHQSIVSPFDHTEFFTTVLLINLAQGMFCPKSQKDLYDKFDNPLTKTAFQKGIKKYKSAFYLEDKKKPFFQFTGPIKKSLKIQNLFPEVPGDNAPSLYYDNNTIKKVCPACVFVGLNTRIHYPFQGTGCSSGFVKGHANFIIHNDNLRKKIWSNVVPKNVLKLHYSSTDNEPLWCNQDAWFMDWNSKVEKEDNPNQFGFLKGALLVGAKLRVEWKQEKCTCDICGEKTDVFSERFYKEPGRSMVDKVNYPNNLGYTQIVESKKDGLLSIPLKTPVSKPIQFSKKLEFFHVIESYIIKTLCAGGEYTRSLPIMNGNHKTLAKGYEFAVVEVGGFCWDNSKLKGSYFESIPFGASLFDNEDVVNLIRQYFELLHNTIKKLNAAFAVTTLTGNRSNEMVHMLCKLIIDKMFVMLKKSSINNKEESSEFLKWLYNSVKECYCEGAKSIESRNTKAYVEGLKRIVRGKYSVNSIIKQWKKERWGE